MTTTTKSIGHRTISTKLRIWLALAGLLIGTASLAACGPDDGVADPEGSAVSVPDASNADADAGTAPDREAQPMPGKDGEPCTVDAECLNGSCITSHRDGDRDGFGDGTGKVTRCEREPAPGYALMGGDCCDSDPGTHPGADYSAVADTCGGFDRNCDGRTEREGGASLACGCITIEVGKFGRTQICTACR
jgi:hypothetical protein